MNIPLRTLIVEDDENDMLLLLEQLRSGGYEPIYERVETKETMESAINKQNWDIIFSDYNMPQFSAPEALKLFNEKNLDIPLIVVSGTIGEEVAVKMMKVGAHDYIMKWNMTRLVSAVKRELAEAENRCIRKQIEKNQILALEILQCLNKSQDSRIMITEILQIIKKHTGTKAIGIRLHSGEDYPYFTQDGFSDDFVSAQNYLCQRDEKGNIIRDINGKPKLECMCGIVLSKQTNSAKSFFTEHGSFWSNSASELYESLSEAERAVFTRGRCIREGYESLAHIPLCSNGEIVGLLQLNDHRKNCLNLELIKFFEGIGNSIGIALKRKMMEEEREKAIRAEALSEQYRKDILTIKELEKLKDDLTAFIVHDLRSLLTGIKGYLRFLSRSKNLGEQDLHDVSKIEQSVNILIDMTANLLDITRMESKELKISRIPCNLNEIIDSAVQQINPQIRAKSVNFSDNTQCENIVVKVEKDLIRRVTLNILSNAMRFLPEKGEITIKSEVLETGGFVVISISDNGTGIPEEYRKKIFDKFVTMEMKKTGQRTSTGLGLTFCKLAVEAHDGTIWIEEREGGGSVFKFTLPTG